jgi:hypothetical protein
MLLQSLSSSVRSINTIFINFGDDFDYIFRSVFNFIYLYFYFNHFVNYFIIILVKDSGCLRVFCGYWPNLYVTCRVMSGDCH